jgi:imidazolonepropionase-like amidohydrolase
MCAATEEARRAGRRTASHAHAVDGVRTSIAARVTTIEHCSFQTEAGIGWNEDLVSEILDAGIYVCHTVFRGPTKLDRDALPAAEQELLDRRARSIGQRLQLTRRLADKGVKLIAGNDAGVSHVNFADFPGDLVLAATGCSIAPVDVLVSATGEAAQALGRDDIGAIAAGRMADLLVVRGDPLSDIRAITQPERVIARGLPAAGPGAALNVLAT